MDALLTGIGIGVGAAIAGIPAMIVSLMLVDRFFISPPPPYVEDRYDI